jgi:uncharacterized protein (DUF2147 family)
MRLYCGSANLFERVARLGGAFVISLGVGMSGAAAESPPGPTATGFWRSNDDNGKANAWFYFMEHNGAYEGRLVKTFNDGVEDPKGEICGKCPGEKKNTPILGLVIVWGMKRHGEKYENGSILDPRDGSVYHAQMEVSPDGQKLFVRGYLGVELFGKTETWVRLPDNSMSVAEIPGEPVAAPATKKKPAAMAPAPEKAAPPAAKAAPAAQ